MTANADRLETRSLSDPALQVLLETNLHRNFETWPPQQWDADMLTLAAIYYHPALAVARAQAMVARGGEVTAAQRPNPSLNVTPGYNFTTLTPTPWLLLGSLEVPLETAGKRRLRKQQAAYHSQAADLAITTAAWQVRAELRAALVEFLGTQERGIRLQEQVRLHEQILERLEQQIRAGAVAGAESVNVRLSLARARLDLFQNDRLRAEALARIAGSVAVPVNTLKPFRLIYDRKIDEDLVRRLSSAEVRRLALVSRPDILAALAEYAASESALQLAIAHQYPDLRLAPGYEYDQGDSKWSLGLTIDLPVLNQNQGPIAEAKARRMEAGARFNEVQARALAEIDRAVEALKVSGRNSELLKEIVQQQRKNRERVDAQVKAGAADRLALLSADLELAAAELSELEGDLKMRQTLEALEDAVQWPFEMPAGALRVER